MDLERRDEIWETEDRDSMIERIIANFIEEIKSVSKSNKEKYVQEKLREILEEKRILEGIYD